MEQPPKYPSLPWPDVVDRVAQGTYRLDTDQASGTGFLLTIGTGPQSHVALLATAWHVVSDGAGGSLAVRDQHGHTVVKSDGRNICAVQVGKGFDSAVVVIESPEPIFRQEQLLPSMPHDMQLARGSEVGWLGFPGIVDPELCFFHGHIAGFMTDPPVYLVDGVAINGVSGGPVFDDRCHLVGLVSAYLPNKVDDATTLPGVSWMVPLNFILAWVHSNLKPRVL